MSVHVSFEFTILGAVKEKKRRGGGRTRKQERAKKETWRRLVGTRCSRARVWAREPFLRKGEGRTETNAA